MMTSRSVFFVWSESVSERNLSGIFVSVASPLNGLKFSRFVLHETMTCSIKSVTILLPLDRISLRPRLQHCVPLSQRSILII